MLWKLPPLFCLINSTYSSYHIFQSHFQTENNNRLTSVIDGTDLKALPATQVASVPREGLLMKRNLACCTGRKNDLYLNNRSDKEFDAHVTVHRDKFL